MEVVNIQQPRKFPRIRNGRKVLNRMGEDEDDGERKREPAADGGLNRFRGWHHSRIIRVSRASGGKDRHSKVLTSKGLRDRRVRLSVATAIQFYDLQDRLGYDQPSKAVEWLIKAASDAISELPSLNSSFPETPKQITDEKTAQGFDSADVDLDGELNFNQSHSQHLALSKSACSSTSETSKGSGLSLSRSEIRVSREKARKRARERAEKEKEREHNENSITQNASFTELLTCGIGTVNTATSPLDYFVSPASSRTNHSSGFSSQIHMGNSLHTPPFQLISGDSNNGGLQQFFDPDGQFPAAGSQQGGAGDYNINFRISTSGLAGFNRGTLQSNLPHFQRYSPVEGANVPLFIGAAVSASPMMENYHHHHHHQFSDGLLQLCYGDGTRLSDQKGKGKN